MKKILSMVLALLLLSSPGFAQDYMSAKIGATAQLIYVQTVNAVTENILVRIDVTRRVPYEVQKVSNEKVLVID
jgi:hypothetical protein